MRDSADFIYDATLKINQSALKDTLIMTDIEFYDNRQFRVRQWWYLMPPHFTADVPISAMSVGNPLYLEGADLNGNGLIDVPTECDDDGDLRTCIAYEDSLEAYHAKSVNTFGDDILLNSTIYGPHGFSHFDFEPIGPTGQVNPNAMLLDVFENGSENTVIYVKGGPVRIKGTYNGRYTVVTDEYTVYRRHATRYLFGGNDLVPRDTVWNNIWLMDDLINVDAFPSGNMANYQPGDDCNNSSENRIFLISGANVIVANTLANRNNININAGIMALNESFIVQYWQNTTDTWCGLADGQNVNCSSPPWGDGRGIEKYGTTGNNDLRGTIYFWGNVIQKYRGYHMRNPPGPYSSNIGYSKSLNYDLNLRCNPPPNFPNHYWGCTDYSSSNYEPLANIDDGSCLFDLSVKNELNNKNIFKLFNAIPNPFNPITTISFKIPKQSQASLKVFDIKGNLISTLLNESINVGHHQIEWNAEGYPSGVYFVKLDAGKFTQTQKLMLVK